MSHLFYISLAYGITAIVLALLIAATWLDGRMRQSELQTLEASGTRRRSGASPKDGAS